MTNRQLSLNSLPMFTMHALQELVEEPIDPRSSSPHATRRAHQDLPMWAPPGLVNADKLCARHRPGYFFEKMEKNQLPRSACHG